MEIYNLIPFVYERFMMFVLVFTRISTLFTTFILFRADIVNPRTLVVLAAILSIYVMLLDQSTPITYDVMSLKMFIQTLFQVLIGFLSGLILNIVFEIFSALGQIISMQIGLSMASMIDPRLGSITQLTHFYTFSVFLIFFLMNGHLYVIQTILDSFTFLPIGESIMPRDLIKEILRYSSIIFSQSVLLSITIIIAIMIVNLALALMSKLAPQFNVFSVGVNMMLIMGLICVYYLFDIFVDKTNVIFDEGLAFLRVCLQHVR